MAKWQEPRSFWTWGFQSDEPTQAQRQTVAAQISRKVTWLVRGRTIGIALAVLDAFEDFFTVNSHGLGCIDANANLVSFHSENRNGYVLANDY
jgi:hypothetical protein